VCQAIVLRNYIAGALTGQLSRLVAVGVGLWLTPYVLQYLDREAFGVFALAMGVVTWLNLADLGTSASLQAHLARISGTTASQEQSRYLSSVYFAQLISAGLILAAGTGAAMSLPHFFEVREDLREPALLLVGCLTVAAAFRQATRIFETVLAAHQRFHWNHSVQMLSVGLRTGCIVVLVSSGWGLLSLGIAHAVTMTFVAAASAVLVRRLLPGIVIRPALVSWELMSQIGRSGVWFGLGGLAGVLIYGLDRAVAAKVISLQAVTILYLSSRLYDLAESLLIPITDTARPVMGRLLGQGDRIGALRAYRGVQRSTLLLSAIAALAIWSGNGAFVAAWVGGDFYGGPALDAALALALIARTVPLPSRAALASGLIVRPQTLVRLAEGVLNLVLSIFLAMFLGLAGVVLGTSTAAAATSAWRLPVMASRMFEAGSASISSSRWALAFGVVLIVSAVCGRWAAESLGGYAGAAMAMGMTAATGLTFIWLFERDQRLRITLRALLPV